MGRIQHTMKNIVFGYIGNLSSTVLGFILRTVFIQKLDETLLGVNGLYTGVLSMLSMAELGIGTALNFSLYAPVAQKNYDKIKSYMQFYKKAYRIIGLIVAVLGIALIPFLKFFIKDPGNYGIRELTLYYLIFLFNTVSTYFVSYKYSLVNAEQKNYIQTNILTITKLATTILQLIVLVVTSNFLLYLLTAAAVELLQKIWANNYLNKRYPYLLDKDVVPLRKEETKDIWDKTKALLCLKIGDIARLQTDSIIISSFIQVAIVGIVDNYNMVINSVQNFVLVIFNSAISSFGNLIATESKQKQYELFKIYRFVANWIYGLSAIGFYVLLTPLVVNLWLGEKWLLSANIVALIVIDYYFKGDRVVMMNFRTAAGVFEQDKFLPLIQGGVNLVISIVLVQKIGLIGVYIGTVISGLIANVSRPPIVYKVCFERKSKEYFIDTAKYLLVMAVILAIVLPLSNVLLHEVTLVSFVLTGVMIVVVYNVIFLLAFCKTGEFRYMYDMVMRRVKR